MIIDVGHINIVVSDMEKTEKFLEKIGFIKKETAQLEGDWISVMLGLESVSADYSAMALPNSNLCIELLKFNSPVSEFSALNKKANTVGYRHISLKVKNIHEEVERLKKLGIKFISDVQEKLGRKSVYFRGPDDIIIQLDE